MTKSIYDYKASANFILSEKNLTTYHINDC